MAQSARKPGRPRKIKDALDVLEPNAGNEILLRVDRDAHDNTYYTVERGAYIVAERINDLGAAIALIKYEASCIDG